MMSVHVQLKQKVSSSGGSNSYVRATFPNAAAARIMVEKQQQLADLSRKGDESEPLRAERRPARHPEQQRRRKRGFDPFREA